jgi:uncharacterized membrane protein
MMQVTLYSRSDCHLCEQARLDLEALQSDLPHRLVVVDVDSTLELKRRFGFEVPVVEVGPYVLKAPFTRQALKMTLGAARDRLVHIDRVERSRALDDVRTGGFWTRSDSFTYWMSRHFMLVINLIFAAYLGFSILAPVLMQVGATGPANILYKGYSLVCHQMAYRSFFLFGEQWSYPREAAGVDRLVSYGQATGQSEADTNEARYAARAYLGEPGIGYKIALCQRDVAIYAAILIFGLVFSRTSRRWPVLPWYVWILVGILPIALDGISQLLSQPPLDLLPYRESTPGLRVLTGALFGFMTAWFGYPLVAEAMRESQQLMAAKWKRLHPAD